MKKVIFILVGLFLVVSCGKETKVVRSGVVSFTVGSVKITSNGKTVDAMNGDRIVQGMKLQTGENSNIEIDFDENSINIIANSTVEITKLLKGINGNENSEFFISNGKILSNVRKKLAKGETFTVNTPTIIAGVRGTEFIISENNGKSTVACTEGKVAVRKVDAPESEAVEVSAGQEVNSNNGKIATVQSITKLNKENIKNIKKMYLDQKKAIRQKFEKDREKIRKAVVDQKVKDKKMVKDLKEKNKDMIDKIKDDSALEKEKIKADTVTQKNSAKDAVQKQKGAMSAVEKMKEANRKRAEELKAKKETK